MKKRLLTIFIGIMIICSFMFGLSACANDLSFKLNFIVDDAIYATIDTSGDETIVLPGNPTKENSTFDGWYWDKDTWQKPFTANSLLDAPLSSDMSVYGKWKNEEVHVGSIELNQTELYMNVDEVQTLTATILPANSTDTSVRWESSNPTVATVVDGMVTALKIGTATITVTTKDGGKIASCAVYVEPVLTENITLNYTNLILLKGETKTLTATIIPANATDTSVIWHSSNSSVVTVENGILQAVGYGNATITVTATDSDKTAVCEVEVIENKIIFKTLKAEGENVYGVVSNDTTTFSFLNEIEEYGNAEYNVYKEITCETVITSKTISLNEGDNTVYVLQTVGKTIKQYTVTIYRRHMYTVIFDVNGGSSVESQTIEEGFYASEPSAPVRTGYTFDCWDYDFSAPILQNMIVTAKWKANTGTPYKVEYYLQNIENDEYTLYTTDFLTGIADTTAVAEIKTIEHFTHALTEKESGRIAPDGSTVLKVYYTRNEYIVIFDGNGGTLQSGGVTQIVKYGSSVIAPTYIRTGYTFDSFDKSLTDIAENQTISAQWIINQYTITLVYGNGQDNRVITQDYATDIEIENPTRAGYAFNGWDNMIPTQMPAENITVTANWEAIFKLDGGAIKGLTEYGKTISELIIPSEIDGVAITSIGDLAFYGYNSYLKEITIPDSITSIGGDAFAWCSFEKVYITDIAAWCNISFRSGEVEQVPSNPLSSGAKLYLKNELVTKLVIPDSVTSISKGAFRGCGSLTEIVIPDSVTDIGLRAFSYCDNLTKATIGKGVTSIGSYAFFKCNNLTEVYITDIAAWYGISFGDDSANPLNNGAKLYLNNKLVTEFIVLDGVASIGDYAFSGRNDLTEIVIPDSVTSIGSYAFANCMNLTKVTIGKGVTSIGDYAFNGCSSLTEIIIPDSVTSIGSYAFANCMNLTKVIIGKGVTSIGDYAFNGCSSLIEIIIPDSVTSIGDHAFSSCSRLIKLTIGNGLTSIGFDVFSFCSGLTEVTISDSVTSIGSYAFAYCTSLTEITIPNSVISIASEAFYGCSNLTEITIPDSVTSIGAFAFENCTNLTKVTIGKGVTSIEAGAFNGCSNLTEVHITDKAAWDSISFGNESANPLNNGAKLYVNNQLGTKFIVPEGSTSIGYKQFSERNDLTEIVIPDSVTSIGDYAFAYCMNLTKVTIGKGVTSIGSFAFRFCWNLTEITIPDSVTSIGSYAFHGCSSLTEITIPNSVTSIGSCAFSGCSNLTEITIPDSVTSIDSYAFKECSSLTEITIPDSVTDIGFKVFFGCSNLTKINYDGTLSQWEAILKDSAWDDYTGDYTVYCTDGTIQK